MATLVLLRATCRMLYGETTRGLRRQLIASLRPFLSYPTNFLQHVTQYRCVVGGVTATVFMLRDSSVPNDILQIYAPSATYDRFVGAMVVCVYNGRDIRDMSSPSLPERFRDSRDVTAQTVFRMQNGRMIVVYRGGLVSPCSPIVRAPCSALVCFVTEHSFGCAYPRLTLQRRSILCDMRLESMDEMERVALDWLLSAGFSFALSPTAWPEFKTTDADPPEPNSYHCTRRWDLCPEQGRYFGDRGSFVDFFDPLDMNFAVLQKTGIPPFGPMVTWRLFTSFNCADRCDRDDPVLNQWLLSSPLFVMQYPALVAGGATKTSQDRYAGTSSLMATRPRSKSI